ncbi:MAG: DUF2314 domain-containing protein [Aquabacterium sp.]|uniref:DUF2314 domain-containing protein n=1 Tax=Aquabacterium sp. TaxID=1872578 RepID=UPI0025B8C3C9|nr:DUF2314 domain-containing protein [Aquabacterium sp.]MBI5927410.1 DUF2314 domain-containing protein [Aquabacterium sp.]
MFVNHRITRSLIPALLLALISAAQAQQAASAPAPAASVAASSPAAAAKASAPAADPKPVEISVNDPAILASIKKARATLDKFLPIAAKDEANNQAVSLKIAIREGSKVEHVWVTPFTQKGKNGKNGFTGTIVDTPEVVSNFKQGQQWSFTRKDVVDWMYYDTAGGKMHGNYSTCAKLTKGPQADRDEMKRMYGLTCGK